MTIRIGTRGSQLALWQAHWVAARLHEHGIQVEIMEIRTQGDVRSESIAGLNTQGVFTKEIQNELLAGRVDLAVHSLKDLPTEPVPGLALAAVPPREAPFDVLITRDGKFFNQLPTGAVVGTGSARRRAQLLHARPDLIMADIRGNVETRLRKLRDGEYESIVLAQAGLRRLGLDAEITELLDASLMLPAVGQGALGLETRADDSSTQRGVANLDHAESHRAVLAERALLYGLRGGCLAPVGAWGRIEPDHRLHLSAVVLSADGTQRLVADAIAADDSSEAATALGSQLAADLLGQGAADLIAASRTA